MAIVLNPSLYTPATPGGGYSLVGITGMYRTTNSMTLVMPPGIQSGDIGFIIHGAIAGDLNIDGWSRSTVPASTTDINSFVKILGPSEPNITITTATASAGAAVVVYRGPNTVTFRGSDAAVNNGSSVISGFDKNSNSVGLVCLSIDREENVDVTLTPSGFIQRDSFGPTINPGYVGYIGDIPSDDYINGTDISVKYGSGSRHGTFVYELRTL